jgi:alkylation response protein AidB-like acyl-CoA dehydrogenase
LRMTSEAIQLHGGIGMTHEADVGMYFKAARVANLVAGDREFHRMRAGLLLGIEWNGTL